MANFYFSFYEPTTLIKRKKIFNSVFTEMQIYGPNHEPRILPWAKCQIFLETLFIFYDIDKNLKKCPCIANLSLFQTVIFIFSNSFVKMFFDKSLCYLQ